MPSKTVKTSLDGDIRRLKVELESKDAFRDLSDLVKSVYKLNPEVELNMKYLDDEEEEITLSSHGELLEAFRIAQEDGRKVLKLFIHSFDALDALSSTSSFVDVESVASSEPHNEKQPAEEAKPSMAIPPVEENPTLFEDEPVKPMQDMEEDMLLVESQPFSEEAEMKEDVVKVEQDAAPAEPVLIPTNPVSSSLTESSDIIELPVEPQSDNEMPVLEPMPFEEKKPSVSDDVKVEDVNVQVDVEATEPEAKTEQSEEKPKETPWPARSDIVAQCVSFITDEKVRAALKDACGLVTRKVRNNADVMDVILDVFAAFPVIHNHALIQMLLPYLDELVRMAKLIVDWNQDAIINYVHLAERLLGNNKFAFQELNLDSILDLLAQAVRTGAKLELDIFWTPNETAQEEPCEDKHEHGPDGDDEKPTKKKKAKKQAVHKHVECDMCGVHPIVGVRYKCTKCRNYDLCAACEAKELHPANHIMMKIRVPVAYAGRARHHQRRYKMEFVRDMTLPDKSIVNGDVVMTKSWTVKNTGAYQWPHGAHLKYISGSVIPVNGKEAKIQVPRAAPGEEVEVTVNVITPVEPGKAHGNFRLMDNRGKSFGERLWLNLSVREVEQVVFEEKKAAVVEKEQQAAPAEEKKVEKPVDNAPPFQYAGELDQLHGMGFKDDEINKYLLLNNKGNVMRVVEWLLQNQASA